MVIGGSAFGELSESTVQLFKDLVAASNARVTIATILRKFAAGIAFCSGHVIAEAERRVGIVHQPSPLQIVKSVTGRKGSAGCAVANDDDLVGGSV